MRFKRISSEHCSFQCCYRVSAAALARALVSNLKVNGHSADRRDGVLTVTVSEVIWGATGEENSSLTMLLI